MFHDKALLFLSCVVFRNIVLESQAYFVIINNAHQPLLSLPPIYNYLPAAASLRYFPPPEAAIIKIIERNPRIIHLDLHSLLLHPRSSQSLTNKLRPALGGLVENPLVHRATSRCRDLKAQVLGGKGSTGALATIAAVLVGHVVLVDGSVCVV